MTLITKITHLVVIKTSLGKVWYWWWGEANLISPLRKSLLEKWEEIKERIGTTRRYRVLGMYFQPRNSSRPLAITTGSRAALSATIVTLLEFLLASQTLPEILLDAPWHEVSSVASHLGFGVFKVCNHYKGTSSPGESNTKDHIVIKPRYCDPDERSWISTSSERK